MRAVLLENIRSAFNVGNIIRTADALGFDVIISGYTPTKDDEKVRKTSLGAEKTIKIYEYWNTKEALEFAKQKYGLLIAAEITSQSKSLDTLKTNIKDFENICIFFGNEVEGVLPESLEFVDDVYHIPMHGKKESLNVGQSAAIFMWELKRLKNGKLKIENIGR